MLLDSDDRLRVYIIWQPILRSDDRASAERRSREFADDRLTCFWDGNLLTGRLWQRILGTQDVAWDVYRVYRADADWEKAPTRPDFWIHAFNGVLAARLKAKVNELRP